MFLHVGPSPAQNFRDGEWRGLLSQDPLPASTQTAQTAQHTRVLQHEGRTGTLVHACVCMHVCVSGAVSFTPVS